MPMNILEGWGAHPVSTVTHLYSLRGVPQRGRCKHRNVILTVCIVFLEGGCEYDDSSLLQRSPAFDGAYQNNQVYNSLA